MKLVQAPRGRWYGSPALSTPRHRVVPIALVCAATFASGCGGGGPRQDANEPSGDYKVQVLAAKFPAKQSLAKRSIMTITIKNVDSKTIPNVAVTVKSFDKRKTDPNLADPTRPQFIVNTGPPGGDTAYVGTSALGSLKPGEIKTFRWDVTAVTAGRYTVRYAVAAGLNGKARAVLAGGGLPTGAFTGSVSAKAPQAHVGADGKTVVTSG
jgi:hypothetical protein